MRSLRLWIVFALLLLVLFWAAWKWNVESPSPEPTVSAAALAQTLPVAELGAVSKLPAGSASSSPGLASRQPQRSPAADFYPLLHELRSRRESGSFAMANRLVMHCLEAQIALSRDATLLRGRENDPDYAQRLKAKTWLERSCERVASADGLALGGKPFDDDAYGKRFVEAREPTQVFTTDPEKLMMAIEELAAQGQWPPLEGTLILLSRWRGEDWRARREEFAAALQLATLEITSESASWHFDLLANIRCYRDQMCNYSHEMVLLNLPTERRANAKRMAAEMLAAMRAGNWRAFFEKSP